MLEYLNETFQSAIKEMELSKTNEGMKEYAENSMSMAIWQKELVEAVIGECVNLQRDGHIRIGVNAELDYEDYLRKLKYRCVPAFNLETLYNDNHLQAMIDFINQNDLVEDFLDELDKEDGDRRAIQYVLETGYWETFSRYDSEVTEKFIRTYNNYFDEYFKVEKPEMKTIEAEKTVNKQKGKGEIK